MTLRLNGDSSGFTEIKAADAAGDNSITLPTSNGGANQLLQNGGTAGALQYTSAGAGLHYDSSGRLLVGTSSDFTNGTGTKLQSVDAAGGQIALGRDIDTLNTGNLVGRLRWYGNVGGTQQETARIAVEAGANHALNDKPGRIVLSTTGVGDSSVTHRVQIGSDGALRLLAGCPGIDFSAISTGTGNGQSATATPDNNMLDDYEEGVFDAEVASTAAGATFTHSNQLFYEKVGKVVNLHGRLLITRSGTASGGVLQFRLPFAADNSSGNGNGAPWMSHGMCIPHDIGFPGDSDGQTFFWEINSTTHAGWFYTRNNNSWSSADPNLIKTTANSYLTFSMTYRAA